MNLKTEIVAFVVRVLANETNLLPKPTAVENFMSDIFGLETQDQRIARQIVDVTDKVAAATSRVKTNRKFKKITTDF